MVGTAKFSVNVETGKVLVTPLNGDPTSRAVFSGTSLSFESGDLMVDTGEITRRQVAVLMRNNTTETIGAPGKGLKVMFGEFKNSTATDLRAQTTVTTYAGSGNSETSDGPLTGAGMFNPYSVLLDEEGSVYFSGNDYGLRVAREGRVVSLIKNTGSLQSMIWEDGRPDTGIIYAVSANNRQIVRLNLEENTSTVIAGNGSETDVDGPGLSAAFENAYAVAQIDDNSGGNPDLLVSQQSGKMRRLTWDGSQYQVSTLGFSFNGSRDMIALGNGLFAIAETFACRVSLFDINGTKTALGSGVGGGTDGDGTTMQFYEPSGLFAYQGSIFVGDTGNTIRQITLDPGANARNRENWRSATLAGTLYASGYADGSGEQAQFNAPLDLAVDRSGNILVADAGNNRIRQVSPTNGRFPFSIGSGAATGVDVVRLANPTDFVPGGASSDPMPYILENKTVEPGDLVLLTPWSLIIPQGVKNFEFTVTVEAETDMAASPDAVYNPGPAVGNGSPRAIVRTLAGVTGAGYADGSVSAAAFSAPQSVAYDAQGNLFVADTENRAIRRITPGGQVSTVAGGPSLINNSWNGHGGQVGFSYAGGIAVNPEGTVVYVTDLNYHWVRRIALNPSADPTKAFNWMVTTIAGSGTSGYAEGAGDVARFNAPWGIALTSGGELIVSESAGNRIRRLEPVGPDPSLPAAWRVSLVAGDNSSASPAPAYADGTGTAARFSDPRGLAVAASGEIYIAERGNHKIRSVNVAGRVKTFAGSVSGFGDQDYGSQAKFNAPMDVAVDRAGYVYVADTENRVIRRISPKGAVRTIAGGEPLGYNDGPGDVARFARPACVEVSTSGDLVVGDANRLRLVERLISSGFVG